MTPAAPAARPRRLHSTSRMAVALATMAALSGCAGDDARTAVAAAADSTRAPVVEFAGNVTHAGWQAGQQPATKDLMANYKKPDESELRERLTPLQFKVTQQEGTEPPFGNPFWDNHEDGIYVDLVSGEPLFSSRDKFDSGTGWPSFTRPLEPDNILERTDNSLFSRRTEVRSKHGDSHLGHVFPDGPRPTGLRYCMNSAALRFVPVSELEAQGYGRYLSLFGRTPATADAAPAAAAASTGAATQRAPATNKEPAARNEPAAHNETAARNEPAAHNETAARNETAAQDATAAYEGNLEVAVLAGGCFWGVEELVRELPGVVDTDVGYTGGTLDHATYKDVERGNTGHAESVRIRFDPLKVSYEDVLRYFFRLHDPTTLNRQGNDKGTSYRSAIFYLDERQKEIAERVKAEVDASGKWKDPVVTQVVAAGPFWRAEEYHQDYLQKKPNGYTCHWLRD